MWGKLGMREREGNDGKENRLDHDVGDSAHRS